MPELQLTRIALIGARMQAFETLGYTNSEELRMQRVAPVDYTEDAIRSLPNEACKELLKSQLPIWIHNIITDSCFPDRARLLMPLHRFEGELRDHRNDEVVSLVLQHGFKSETLNPLALPGSIPLRQRCLLLVNIGVWQQAYLRLETEVVDLLTENALSVARWCETARAPDNAIVDGD